MLHEIRCVLAVKQRLIAALLSTVTTGADTGHLLTWRGVAWSRDGCQLGWLAGWLAADAAAASSRAS